MEPDRTGQSAKVAVSTRTPFESLALITAEMRKHGEAGDWNMAAGIASQMNALIEGGRLPPAQAPDRAAIEAALANIAALKEHAGPLREDIGRLLVAFGEAPPTT